MAIDRNISFAGDSATEAAFGEIFERHYRLTYSVAFRVLGDAHEAEEVAQEAFLALYRLWPNLTVRTSLNAWLAKTALNLSFNRLRTRKLNRRLASELERLERPLTGPSVEETAGAEEERRAVRLALIELKPRDRACLIARHSGLSYQEVADVAGVRATSVGKVLARAEARFKRAYERLTGEDLG